MTPTTPSQPAFAPSRRSSLASLLLTTLLAGLLTGCGGETSTEEGPSAAAAAVETGAAAATRDALPAQIDRYEWWLEKTTPGGTTVLTRHPDRRVVNASFLHWNNREYTLDSTLQLDEDGLPSAQRISGTGPFGAPIDEEFSLQGEQASWKTLGEAGSARASGPAFYWPNETAALGSMEALVRAASERMNGEISLYPRGTARVEKRLTHTVQSPEGPVELHLWAVFGTGFTPEFAWFDDDQRLRVIASGWLGMVPEGWDRSLLSELGQLQTAENTRLLEAIAGDLGVSMSRDVLITGVDVIDVEAGVRLEAHNVHLAGGRIQSVSPAMTGIEEIPGAFVIDGQGKTLIPGLWDMHGHFGLPDGIMNIAGGVTSVRDIGAEHEEIMKIVARIDAGEVIGPTTYRAGFMDRAGPFASGFAAESLEQALDRVDFFAEEGYLQVKLYSSIEPEWVAPIAERAHGHGLRLSGHIPAFMSAEQAVRAGYDEIQHINMVFLNFLAGDREDTRKQLRFTLYGDEAGNLDLDSPEVTAFLDLLRDEGVTVDPTAAIFDTMLRHLPGEPDPTFAPVIEHLPPSVARRLYSPEMDIRDRSEAWARSAEAQAEMIRRLFEHGIQLIPGSDHMPAFTLHRELELYVEAGIPAMDVLRIASLDAARVVGAEQETGSITAGKVSDLVLVDGNPLEDMSAIRRATLVVRGNTLYRPDALYQAVGVRPFIGSESLSGLEISPAKQAVTEPKE